MDKFTETLRRYAVYARIIGIIILIALLGFIVYQLYDFYSDKVGFTPTKAIESYFQALSQGDYEQVYQLTDKDALTDIYGRPITKSEFMEQLRGVGGDQRIPIVSVESEKLVESKGSRYYVVTLYSNVNGTSGTSRLVVEMRKSGNIWLIRYPLPIIL